MVLVTGLVLFYVLVAIVVFIWNTRKRSADDERDEIATEVGVEVASTSTGQFWIWYWILFGPFLFFRVFYALPGTTAHVLNQAMPVLMLMVIVAGTYAAYRAFSLKSEPNSQAEMKNSSSGVNSPRIKFSDRISCEDFTRFEVLARAINEKYAEEPELGLRLRQYFLKNVEESGTGFSIFGISHQDKKALYFEMEACLINRLKELQQPDLMNHPVQNMN